MLLVRESIYLGIQGHAVFVEDAIEMNNVIHRNLVVLTRYVARF